MGVGRELRYTSGCVSLLQYSLEARPLRCHSKLSLSWWSIRSSGSALWWGDEQALGTAGTKGARRHCDSILHAPWAPLFIQWPWFASVLSGSVEVSAVAPAGCWAVQSPSELQFLATFLSCADLGFQEKRQDTGIHAQESTSPAVPWDSHCPF